MNPEQSRTGPAIGLALLAGSAVAFLLVASGIRHPLDDAYISYRYARNLSEGLGLVFNPGEYVEGFTNLLWTLLVAAGVALGGRAPAVGFGLGLVSGLLALGATWLYASTWLRGRPAWLAGIAPALVLSTYAFPRWAMSGLETPLFITLVTGALAAFARQRLGWTTGLLIAATLTRPDGALCAGIVFGFHLLFQRRDFVRALRWPLVYAAALLLLTGFRLLYYGAPVPNTYYAKVGGIPMAFGVLHVRVFLAEGAAWLLPPAALALRDRRAWPGAAYVVALALYVVWIGGDVFAHRFLLPGLPCLAGLAVVGVGRAFAWRRAAGVAAGACVVLSACTFALGTVPLTPGALRDALSDPYYARRIEKVQKVDRGFEGRGRRTARVLRERREDIRLVAAGAIGAFGYYSRLPILDLYGLVDSVVARSPAAVPDGRPEGWIPGHQRSNAEYVLSRRPDYILIPRHEERLRGLVPAHDHLWSHPEFARLYVWDPAVPGYRLREGESRSPMPGESE